MRKCEDFSSDYFGEMRLWAKANSVPLKATFELTPFCNFRCVMCYVRLNEEQAKSHGRLLDADEWLETARQAKEEGTLHLTLTGGEPFLHPEFWKIYSELNKMGFLITLLSNGSLIDEAVMEKFEMYGMPYAVKLTVYGASDETYQKVCGSKDGFTRVCKAIELLENAKVPLTLTSTIVRENAHDLNEIYALARKYGLPMQHTVSVMKSFRNENRAIEASRFSFDEFSDELTREALEKSKFPPLESPFAWCASKNMSFWITWNGNMQLCSFMSNPCVSCSGSFKDDWKKLLKKLDEIKSPKECENCEWSTFCQRCPGILCAESGSAGCVSESLCNMAKRLTLLYRKSCKEDTL
ncbi:MAG: radical SAM protein [Clostridia bacterium]|nr:radical SAM protein [Clostridia bacterium]